VDGRECECEQCDPECYKNLMDAERLRAEAEAVLEEEERAVLEEEEEVSE